MAEADDGEDVEEDPPGEAGSSRGSHIPSGICKGGVTTSGAGSGSEMACRCSSRSCWASDASCGRYGNT